MCLERKLSPSNFFLPFPLKNHSTSLTPCSQELCYTPMWPVIYSPGKHQGGIYAGAMLTDDEMLEFWTPKCITREDFDCGGGRAREPQYQLPDVPYQECKSLQLG